MEKVRKLLLNNLHLKIISLLIAFLLWLNLNLPENSTFEIVIPVEIENLPEDYIIEKYYPHKVNLVIEGQALSSVVLTSIKVVVDASKVKEGKNLLPIIIKKERRIKVNIKKVFPDTVVLFVRRK